MDAKEINEEFEKLQLTEMSMAWEEQLKGKNSVCAWVEGPLHVDNQYIKYYDNEYYNEAKRVARIRINEPRYVGGNHKEGNKENWILSEKEKKVFIELLKKPCKRNPQFTNWQQIILTYNADNFHIYEPIKGDMTKYKGRKAPSMPEHLLPFPIDYPMPDYTELK